ncbi:MAG TPA: PKD domain-containing protein, partial [Thermoplasmatales archaeon]|nr:PKD domain-containing protein [Thermoplasmatales archaeon]
TDRNATHSYADDGIYNVALTVTDNSGLSNSTYKSINVSNTPPVAVDDKISTLTDTPVEINVTANDYDRDGIIANISIIENTSHGNLSINPNGLVVYSPEHGFTGEDQFIYIAIDDDNASSNQATVLIEVGSPIKPPRCSFSYTPQNPTTEDVIQFHDTSTDDKGIVSWHWDFGDGNISEDKDPPHRYKTAGTYTVTLRVEDSDGLNDTASKNIIVRERDHPVYVEIEYPQNNSVINGTIEIRGKASSDKPIQKVEIKFDSGSWITIAGSEEWSYLWDTTKVSNGLHTIYVRGYNGYSYSDIESVQVTVNNVIIKENQPPVVEISYPPPGLQVSGVVHIIGTAYDSDGEMQKVEIKIDNNSWITVNGRKTWEYSWNTSDISEGIHHIYARSYDGVDYSSIVNIQITVSNTLPLESEESQKTSFTLPIFIIIVILIGAITVIPIIYIIKV